MRSHLSIYLASEMNRDGDSTVHQLRELISQLLTDIIHSNHLELWELFCPCFADEELEAQRGDQNCGKVLPQGK